VYVTDDRSAGEQLRDQWDALDTGVPMVVLDSPYRATSSALLKYLDMVQKREPPHTFITVLLAEVLPTRWWHPARPQLLRLAAQLAAIVPRRHGRHHALCRAGLSRARLRSLAPIIRPSNLLLAD
jgi:hypothetical protein